MIAALPNQPLAFDDSKLRGCCSIDPEECLLVDPADTLTFQVVAIRCPEDSQLVNDPGFDTGDGWRVDGWTIADGQACYTAPFLTIIPPNAGTMEDFSFGPVPGSFFEIHIVVDAINLMGGRGVFVYFGGVFLGTLSGTGEYTFYATAETGQGLYFVSDLGPQGTICIETAEVYERQTDYTIEFIDASESVALSLSYGDPGTTWAFNSNRLTVGIDFDELDIAPGCYTIQFTDGCEDTTLTSQCVNIGAHDCTVQITACSSSDMLGFKGGFRPQIRVPADLKRPKFSYEFGQEKTSKGRLNRYYAERTRTMELRIGRVGEFTHNFLSTLPLWDHVYIGQDPWVITSESYEPDYADVYAATGGVILEVQPYEEDAKKVRCDEDDGGCSPPPNYWVQGTGPNEDYIIQEETGERILIN